MDDAWGLYDVFDEDLSDLDEDCVCVEEYPDACLFHKFQEPTAPNGIEGSLRSLYIKRRSQREKRKVELKIHVPAWWYDFLRRMKQEKDGCIHCLLKDAEEIGKEEFGDHQDELSETEDGCICESETEPWCPPHKQKLTALYKISCWPLGFEEVLRIREDAKIYYKRRNIWFGRYQKELKAAEERWNRSRRPQNYEWFRRISREMKHAKPPPQRGQNAWDIRPQVPNPPLTLFDEDISSIAASDCECDIAGVAEWLCGCDDEISDCDCGAFEDADNGTLDHLQPEYDHTPEGSDFGDMSIDDHKFLQWNRLRNQRKRNILSEEIEEDGDEWEEVARRERSLEMHRNAETEAMVKYKEATPRTIKSHFSGMLDTHARVFNLYSSQLIGLSDRYMRRFDRSCTLSFAPEGSGNNRLVSMTLVLGRRNPWTASAVLPKKGGTASKEIKFDRAHVKRRGRTPEQHNSATVRLVFISNDYVKLQVPGADMFYQGKGGPSRQAGDLGTKDEQDFSDWEEEPALPGWIDFVGVDRKAETEVRRVKDAREERVAITLRVRRAQVLERGRSSGAASPRDTYFNNNHPMGANYAGGSYYDEDDSDDEDGNEW